MAGRAGSGYWPATDAGMRESGSRGRPNVVTNA